MRKGLLAVFSGGIGCVMMVVFSLSIAWQCIPVYAAQTLQLQDPLVTLPCGVEGTELIAKHLVHYEGPYWESGGQEVAGVAALLVENAGCLMVAHGAVILQWGADTLVFELSSLPPGERVLVLEKDRQTAPQARPDQCYGWVKQEYPENMGHVTVEAVGGTTMAVVNRTAGEIPLVQICYKTRDPGSGIFLGGISYTVEVRNLRPGEKRLLSPYRYVCGHSAVVRVLTYVE